MYQIFAVVHGTASLPCDISPPIPHDPTDMIILVVWYRNEKTAIYRQVEIQLLFFLFHTTTAIIMINIILNKSINTLNTYDRINIGS